VSAPPVAASAAPAAFTPPPHSIAVLPFINMSGDLRATKGIRSGQGASSYETDCGIPEAIRLLSGTFWWRLAASAECAV
jgi:hypothetical protein